MPKSFDFRLDIYGVLWDAALIEAAIARNALSAPGEHPGFAPEEELDKAIASAHLSFNLRYPTMGEASGGILRSWALGSRRSSPRAAGIPACPRRSPIKSPLKTKSRTFRPPWRALKTLPDDFARMGRAAHEWLRETHSLEGYANTLRQALADHPRLFARFAARRMLLRAALTARSRPERDMLVDRAAAAAAPLFGRRVAVQP